MHKIQAAVPSTLEASNVLVMFNLRKKRISEETKEPVFRGGPGKRLYAIGDVHGCFDEMIGLIGMIEKDHLSRTEKPCIIVFLGDLMDRGPKSREVIEFVSNWSVGFAKAYSLVGNHEEMMVRAMTTEPDLLAAWMKHGGSECIESYGLNPHEISRYDSDTASLMIRKSVPKSHLDFLSNCPESIRFGDYLLVHAGINPERPVDQQDPREMRWIRQPFLDFEKPLDVRVVHGHTIEEQVAVRGHRVGVDTGAYETGVLSAVRIEDEDLDVLSFSAS